jgi:hypothetical protein
MKHQCQKCSKIVESKNSEVVCPSCGTQINDVSSYNSNEEKTSENKDETDSSETSTKEEIPLVKRSQEVWIWCNIIALLLVLYGKIFISLGLNVTGDSMNYLTASLNYVQTGELALDPLWPPFYPWLISVFQIITPFPADAAALLNACSYVLMVISLCFIGRILKFPKTLLVTFGIFLCFWWELMFVYQAVWSGGLFATLWAVHLLFILLHVRNKSLLYFAGVCITMGLMLQTRYIGYCLGPAFGLYLLYIARKLSLKNQIGHSIILLLSLFPHILWLRRNWLLSETLHGIRQPSNVGFSTSLDLFFSTLWEVLVSTPLLIPLLILSGFCFTNPLRKFQTMPQKILLFYYTLVSGTVYSILLIYSAATVVMDPISPRFVAPLLPGVFVLIILGVRVFWQRVEYRAHLYSAVIVCLLGSLVGGYFLLDTGKGSIWLFNYFEKGSNRGYVQTGFSHSNTGKYLEKILAEEFVGNDQVDVLLIDDYKMSNKYQSLVFRSTIFRRSMELKSYDLLDYMKSEVSLDFQDTTKKLVLHAHFHLKNSLVLKESIRRIAREQDTKEVLVIGKKNIFRKLEMSGLVMDINQQKPCVLEHKLPPYELYRCYMDWIDEEAKSIQDVSSGELLFSELMVTPKVTKDYRGEWIELYNTSNEKINLRGLKVSDGKNAIVIGSPIVIFPESYVVLAVRDNPIKNGMITEVDAIYSSQGFQLGLKGTLTLSNNDDVIDSITYDVRADKMAFMGKSISFDKDSSSSIWCPSTSVYGSGDHGTPKQANDSCIEQKILFNARKKGEKILPVLSLDKLKPGQLVISEMMLPVNPDKQWFELHNTGSAPMNLKGLKIHSNEEDGFVIDKDLFVPPKKHVVLAARTPFVDVDYVYTLKEFSMAVAGKIILSTTNGSMLETVMLHQFAKSDTVSKFSNASSFDNDTPKTWCDGTTEYKFGYGTPRNPNVPCAKFSGRKSQTQLIISEIMIEPSKVEDYRGEWFEIYNSSDNQLNLNGIQFLSKEGQSFTITEDILVAAKSYAVLSTRSNVKVNGGIENVVFQYNINEFNLVFNDFIEIRDAAGIIDRVEFIAGRTHPQVKGRSLVLRTLDTNKNDLPEEWCVANTLYGLGDMGTPGKENSTCPSR